MTETWAGLLREASTLEADESLSDAGRAKLRRLASLLEQITPEMAADVKALATFVETSDSGWVVRFDPDEVGDLLQSLAATPSEETD